MVAKGQSKRVKPSEALAYVRHLSCLGLPGELVIPRMLEAIHELIPSSVNTFVWTDGRGSPINMFAPELLPSTINFMTEGYHLCRRPGELSIETLVNGPLITGNMARWYADGSYDRTVAANEVFKPQGTPRTLDLVIRDDNGPRGLVLINRAGREPRFTPREQRLLAGLAPWFLRVLDEARPFVGRQADTGDEAVLLCNPAGDVLQASPGARRLALYARYARVVPGVDAKIVLPDVVRRVCRQFRAALAGLPTRPPRARLETQWGVFVFRVHPLADDLLAVVIRREEPLPLKIMRRLKSLPLSPREREVALMIGLGRGPEDVRTRLGITRSTYRDYVERIHSRLEVHNRAELVAALTA